MSTNQDLFILIIGSIATTWAGLIGDSTDYSFDRGIQTYIWDGEEKQSTYWLFWNGGTIKSQNEDFIILDIACDLEGCEEDISYFTHYIDETYPLPEGCAYEAIWGAQNFSGRTGYFNSEGANFETGGIKDPEGGLENLSELIGQCDSLSTAGAMLGSWVDEEYHYSIEELESAVDEEYKKDLEDDINLYVKMHMALKLPVPEKSK